jgi:hypothetical protein
VFNDLDWVPANHWQAEDRAYRLGQTRTVNVTYVVGQGTIDDFVQTVLETKSALVQSVVEGAALASDMPGNVLEELERALAAVSPGLADTPATALDQAVIDELVRDAAARWQGDTGDTSRGEGPVAPPAHVQALRAALETLARVLSGPCAQQFRISSSSNPGSHYVIVVEEADVTYLHVPGLRIPGARREGSVGGG